MLVSLTVGKIDAGITVLLTHDKRLIEFPSILLPQDIALGSIVDITVARNHASEAASARTFQALQDRILNAFGAQEPSTPVLRVRNATQTSVVLEWDPIHLATAELLSLSLYRNGQKAGAIPRPLAVKSTKMSGLSIDTEYAFHLVLRTTAGTYISEKVAVRTHKMTDLSGVTITTGVMPPAVRESLLRAVARIGAKLADEVRIDTTHFVTTEGRGVDWERAVENNIPVVRPEWVDACERSGRILGVTNFYLDAMRPVTATSTTATTTTSSTNPAASSPTASPVTHHGALPTRSAAPSRGSAAGSQDSAPVAATAADASDDRWNSERPPEQQQQQPVPAPGADAEQKTLAAPADEPGGEPKSKQDEKEAHDDGSRRRESGVAAAASPDRASFQDVAL